MKKTIFTISIFAACIISACNINSSKSEKKIFIPKDLKNQDLNNPDCTWCYQRSDTSENFVYFWEKGFGNSLSNPPRLDTVDMSVDLKNLKKKCEQFYAFYKDSLKFILPGSKADTLKMMVMLKYSLEGTAYGGDYDQTIGALWVTPLRLRDTSLNCIAHEIGHSFQSQISSDGEGDSWGGSGFFEMTSQWMLRHVNPNWETDENYHFDSFKHLTSRAFLHSDNIYHSPYVLEYWSDKHGLAFIADLFRNGKIGEDPVVTYKRITNISQEEFNDEIFEAQSKIINFDFKNAYRQTRKYACQLNTPTVCTNGFWSVDKENFPQQYGFNVIEISIPKNQVTIQFFSSGKEYEKCWRYGFVSITDNGKAVYTRPVRSGCVSFEKGDSKPAHLYFVVMNAPETHKVINFFDPEVKIESQGYTFKMYTD